MDTPTPPASIRKAVPNWRVSTRPAVATQVGGGDFVLTGGGVIGRQDADAALRQARHVNRRVIVEIRGQVHVAFP